MLLFRAPIKMQPTRQYNLRVEFIAKSPSSEVSDSPPNRQISVVSPRGLQ